MSNESNCFFCGSECDIDHLPSNSMSFSYKCCYCGRYILDSDFPVYAPNIDINDDSVKFKIACVLNERRLKKLGGVVLDDKTDKEETICGLPCISVSELMSEFPDKASGYLNKTLLNLSRLTEHPFDFIKFNICTSEGRLLLFAPDTQTCVTILKELSEQGLIKIKTSTSSEGHVISLTARFWEYIENLEQTGIDSKQVFVAMWFDKSMDDYYNNGIKPAIEEAGYDPVRIDGKDFNGKICDEIIAEINRSKFVIADFCKHRGGVYFEAGYAMGQGKSVIFTASKEELKKAHFDTRQYNHIEYDSPEDLRKKLYNRICATIV